VTLLATLTPPEMRRRLDELIALEPSVKVTWLILLEARMWEWVHSVGVVKDPVLGGMVPAIPPDPLRRIVSDHQIEMFLWTGYLDVRAILETVERLAPATGRPLRILDFGAGCGRILRFLWNAEGVAEIHGAEINRDLLFWCEEHLRFAKMHLSSERPPIAGLEDRSLDCLYAVSVATHVDRETADAWRREFARLLAPGGIAILTTHGYTVLDRIVVDGILQEYFRMSSAEAAAVRSSLPEERFVFKPYDADIREKARAGAVYGNTFIDPELIKSEWNDDLFEVVETNSAGLRGWQDVIVLRRRA
jgi:SAM-dependent methyltransferase